MNENDSSETLHLPDLSIKGFRGIADLSIPALGRVNLITGRNNVGKSSILEALRIFAQNAAPQIIMEILRNREEDFRAGNEADRLEGLEELENAFPLSSLFYGFPKFPNSSNEIVVSSKSEGLGKALTIFVDWVPAENFAPRSQASQRRGQPSFSEDFGDILSLVVETENGPNFYRLEEFIRPFPTSRLIRSRRIRMPHQFVSSHGSGRTGHLGPLWDEVVYQGVERYVLDALHIIEPRISSLFMVGDEGVGRSRKAIVRMHDLKDPVPLRSLGDGINRVVVIILSLINAGGGLLLVDEFENGLHHTVQLDGWRMIFSLAKELKVQMFATSHSRETVAAFQQASAEVAEEGRLIRLSRWGDEIIATTLGEEELLTAVEHNIETR